jgi:hypothetical protein
MQYDILPIRDGILFNVARDFSSGRMLLSEEGISRDGYPELEGSWALVNGGAFLVINWRNEPPDVLRRTAFGYQSPSNRFELASEAEINQLEKAILTAKTTVNLFDSNFAHLTQMHGYYSVITNKRNCSIRYVRGLQQFPGTTVVTDNYLLSDLPKTLRAKQKIAWLVEPKAISPTIYERVSEYIDYFDLVLTHDQSLLDLQSTKIRFIPVGGSWINSEDYGMHAKTKNISIIYSEKAFAPGHKLRHEIATSYFGKIDAFGTGAGKPINDKLDALKDYKFSIVIENSEASNYFSEKLLDCFAVGTIPIYWGCPNVSAFFNSSGIFPLSSLRSILRTPHEIYCNAYSAAIDNMERMKAYDVTEDWLVKSCRWCD